MAFSPLIYTIMHTYAYKAFDFMSDNSSQCKATFPLSYTTAQLSITATCPVCVATAHLGPVVAGTLHMQGGVTTSCW